VHLSIQKPSPFFTINNHAFNEKIISGEQL
jgi:hypothetical protein